MNQDTSTPDPVSPPRRKRRWWRGLGVLVSLLFLLVFGLATWVYRDQTFFINQALGRLPQVDLTVGHAEINFRGDFEIREVAVKAPNSDELLAEIPKISGEIDWKELYQGRIRKLEIAQPKLRLDPWLEAGKRLESLPRLTPMVEEVVEATLAQQVPSAPTPQLKDYHLDELKLRDVELEVAGVRTMLQLDLQGLHLKDGIPQSVAGVDLKAQLEGALASEKPAQVKVQAQLQDRQLSLTEIEVSDVHVESPLLKQLQTLFPSTSSEVPQVAEPGTLSEIQDLGFDEVKLDRFALQRFSWRLDEVIKGVRSSGILDLEISAVHWKFGAPWATGKVSGTLEPFIVEHSGEEEGLKATHTAFDLELMAGRKLKVGRLDASAWKLNWGPELQQALSQFSQKGDRPASNDPIQVELAAVHVRRADLEVVLGPKTHEQLVIRSLADFQLKDVIWDGKALQADALQRLEVSQLWVGYPQYPHPGNTEGFVEIPRGLLELHLGQWLESYHVEHLELESPRLQLSANVTPWWDAQKSEANPPQSEFRVPFWKRLNFHELVVDDGLFEFDQDPLHFPRVTAKWEIKTERGEDALSLHRVHLHEVSAHLPAKSNAPFPVLQIPTLEVEVKLPKLWTDRHLEAVRVANASIEANEKLLQTFGGGSPTPTAPAEPEKRLSLMKAWTVGKLDFVESYLSVSELIPGIPTLRFGVDFRSENTPLEWHALQSHLEPQKVVLSQINIPSPYQPLRSVAQLEEVILTFSLEGLAHQRIDSVQIQRPKVFVGEDLFWYIDYYRNYRPELVVQELPVGWSVWRDTLPSASVWQVPFEELTVYRSLRQINEHWSVTHLEVNQGELILAPKGKPIQGFKKPFPFNLSTELEKGTLEAELDIPVDTYTLEELKLELVGMRGKIQFNLPLKDRDNNLVETFQVDAIRWKDLKTGEAYLTLTYDAMGIYAKFGAEAYDGYVNGEVNVYLDDSYHWDGWVSGKAVATKPITDKLSTAYFMLDGKMDLTVIGQGSKSEIYQADLDFVNATKGELSIRALNDMIEELSGDPQEISYQLNQLTLETLRDFQYDEAVGKARIYGREGKGYLNFKGPYGSRNFEINVFDHRWKVDDLDF